MPNMGKSTLLNALLSDDLAIVTSRPQTTRHAILGVMSYGSTQLCLTDTPGIIGTPAYRLQEGMMDVVRSSVRDADAYLVVTDVYSGGKEDEGGGEGVAVAGGGTAASSARGTTTAADWASGTRCSTGCVDREGR